MGHDNLVYLRDFLSPQPDRLGHCLLAGAEESLMIADDLKAALDDLRAAQISLLALLEFMTENLTTDQEAKPS